MNRPPPSSFARVFRQWRTLHPYNAVQAMRLDRLPGDWRRAVAPLPTWLRGELVPERVAGDFDGHITAELNRPFGEGEPPLRPWVLGDWAGLTYDHWAGDSVAIRLIMRRWAEATAGGPLSPVVLDAGKRPAGGPWLGETLQMMHANNRLQRCRRVRGRDPAAAFTTIELPPDLLPRLLVATRRHGVTLNHLFVAAAARAVARILPIEVHFGRLDVAVGGIEDTRHELPPSRRERFGLHLGFRSFVFRTTDLRTLNTAVQRARQEAARPRADRLALALAATAGRFLRGKSLARFYRKRQPLAAGVSNVNLDRNFIGNLHPSPIRHYTRVSPLGPATPIVFTPTTLGGRLHLGVTHRPATFEGRDRQCIDLFVRDLLIAAGL
jgi:hypothetical protein